MPNRQSLTLRAKISPWLALGLLMSTVAYAATAPAVDPLAQSTTSATVIDPLATSTPPAVVDPLAQPSGVVTAPVAGTAVDPLAATVPPMAIDPAASTANTVVPVDAIPVEPPVVIDPALVSPPAH